MGTNDFSRVPEYSVSVVKVELLLLKNLVNLTVSQDKTCQDFLLQHSKVTSLASQAASSGLPEKTIMSLGFKSVTKENMSYAEGGGDQ